MRGTHMSHMIRGKPLEVGFILPPGLHMKSSEQINIIRHDDSSSCKPSYFFINIYCLDNVSD